MLPEPTRISHRHRRRRCHHSKTNTCPECMKTICNFLCDTNWCSCSVLVCSAAAAANMLWFMVDLCACVRAERVCAARSRRCGRTPKTLIHCQLRSSTQNGTDFLFWFWFSTSFYCETCDVRFFAREVSARAAHVKRRNHRPPVEKRCTWMADGDDDEGASEDKNTFRMHETHK